MEPHDERVAQVRELLAHLYDYGYCQKHPLAARVASKARSPRERMRTLRRLVLESIEAMRPRPGAQPSSAGARCYQALRMHYVEGRMAKEIAYDFGLSPRQVYRYLRKAEDDLTAIFWSNLLQFPATQPARDDVSRDELVLQEAQRFGGDVELVPLAPLVKGALAFVERLAKKQAIRVSCQIEPLDLDVLTNRQLLRHALVNALSYAVQNTCPGEELELSATRIGRDPVIELFCSVPLPKTMPREFPPDVQQLVKSLGGSCQARKDAAGSVRYSIRLRGSSRHQLLVIDDDEGVAELVRRYLTGTDYAVISATGGADGLDTALAESPDIIMLDVLMSHQDGWEILQILQSRPETQSIPVVVCSVFNDPKLAFSLGAAGFISKPIRREQLVEALESAQG